MPKAEILRSCQYWADLHRRKAARRTRATISDVLEWTPAAALSDGQLVVTFVPGNPNPITQGMHHDGRLTPLPLPASASSSMVSAMRKNQKRLKSATTQAEAKNDVLRAQTAAADAALLARLNGPRKNGAMA